MLLDRTNNPKDLKTLVQKDLPKLADEIRQEIIDVVSETGGHLASSLGAVELAIAVHYVLDTPRDKVVWDTGHQAYAHKILTGRRKAFKSLRQLGGLSGFPNKDESEYDVFTTGHSSTSISSALGLAIARDLRGTDEKVVAIIGDAALANGMAFEAMNHVGHLKKDLIIILNDNEHSISRSVGALSRYLNTILVNPLYNRIHSDLEKLVKKIPKFGLSAYRAARRLEEGIKNLLVPGIFFEELGFRYLGPIDGNSIDELISKLRHILNLRGPILLHTMTKKGKGYKFSEECPTDFHGSCPFDKISGRKTEEKKTITYTAAFSEKIVELAERRSDIVAVSAAMLDGTGLDKFAERFPNRIFDVGIAEEHAVTFAAALARGGLRPFVAIYSTFLQRAYDQIVHDVCLQNLGVVLCLDRAGLVGEDGVTHNGIFDIAYLRHIPDMILAAPRNAEELKTMMELAADTAKPFSIRYPRGGQLFGLDEGAHCGAFEVGRAEVLREGKHLAILALGSMVNVSLKTAELLSKRTGIEAEVVNARFVRPLDGNLIESLSKRFKKFVTVEEGVLNGGFGSAVLEFIERENIRGLEVKIIGLPDEFIEHGGREELLRRYNLTPEGIARVIAQELFDRQL